MELYLNAAELVVHVAAAAPGVFAGARVVAGVVVAVVASVAADVAEFAGHCIQAPNLELMLQAWVQTQEQAVSVSVQVSPLTSELRSLALALPQEPVLASEHQPLHSHLSQIRFHTAVVVDDVEAETPEQHTSRTAAAAAVVVVAAVGGAHAAVHSYNKMYQHPSPLPCLRPCPLPHRKPKWLYHMRFPHTRSPHHCQARMHSFPAVGVGVGDVDVVEHAAGRNLAFVAGTARTVHN